MEPGDGSVGARPLQPGLLAGVAAPFRGIGFSFANGGVLPWALAPLAVTALLATASGIAGFHFAGSLAPDLAEPWPGWIEWARGAAAWAGEALIRLAGGLLGVYLGIAVSGVVTAPLLDLLSERVEAAFRGRAVPGRSWSYFAADSLRALRAAAFLLLFQVIVLTPLFLLSFTAVGAPIFTVAGAWFAGLSAADFVLGRKRIPGRERLRWALRRPGFLLGLGAPLAFVPPLLPFAVVGSTLAYLEERGDGGE